MDKYRKLLNNSLFLLLGNFGSKILSFFMVRYYTSVYTTSQYGIVDLIITTAGFVIPLITLGINEAVFRFSIDDLKNRVKIYSSGLIIAAIGNCVLGVVCFALNADIEIINYKYYLLLVCVTNSFYLLTATFCRGIERTELYAWTGIFHSIIQVLVAVFSISVLHQGIFGFFIAIVIANILSCILIWHKLSIFIILNSSFTYDIRLIKTMLSYSIPLIANACFWWILASLDKYVIAIQLGSESNGLYAAASKIPAIIVTINSIVLQAWQISSVTEMNSDSKTEFYTEIHDVIYIVIALISSVLMVLMRPIHSVLVGESFFEAWVYTPFLIIAMNFSCLASFYGSNYVAMKNSKGALWTSMVAAIVNIVLNVVLTRFYGMYGTAFATMSSYLVLWIIRRYNTSDFVTIKTNIFKLVVTFTILIVQALIICTGLYSIVNEIIFFIGLIILHKKIIRFLLERVMFFLHHKFGRVNI